MHTISDILENNRKHIVPFRDRLWHLVNDVLLLGGSYKYSLLSFSLLINVRLVPCDMVCSVVVLGLEGHDLGLGQPGPWPCKTCDFLSD